MYASSGSSISSIVSYVSYSGGTSPAPIPGGPLGGLDASACATSNARAALTAASSSSEGKGGCAPALLVPLADPVGGLGFAASGEGGVYSAVGHSKIKQSGEKGGEGVKATERTEVFVLDGGANQCFHCYSLRSSDDGETVSHFGDDFEELAAAGFVKVDFDVVEHAVLSLYQEKVGGQLAPLQQSRGHAQSSQTSIFFQGSIRSTHCKTPCWIIRNNHGFIIRRAKPGLIQPPIQNMIKRDTPAPQHAVLSLMRRQIGVVCNEDDTLVRCVH